VIVVYHGDRKIPSLFRLVFSTIEEGKPKLFWSALVDKYIIESAADAAVVCCCSSISLMRKYLALLGSKFCLLF
jgi:hypothetical protein